MHYRYWQGAAGFLAYLVGMVLIWIFVVQEGKFAATPFARWGICAAWALLTTLCFSAIEAAHATPRSLAQYGSALILIGIVSATLLAPFAPATDPDTFLFGALLYPSAAAGANFLSQGALEMVRGGDYPNCSTDPGATPPQRVIEVGFFVLLLGLATGGIAVVAIESQMWGKLVEQTCLLLAASVGLNLVTQGVVERARGADRTAA